MGSKRYEKKINNPPELPKALFKPEPSRVDANPPRLGEDNVETYYVVEIFDKYVDGFRKRCVDSDLSKVQVTTTKSLVDCFRFDTYEESKKIADKYNCNVRKVIVKVEE